MKLAIVGSRKITSLDLDRYLPNNVTEIVSGGAKGIDTIARQYAIEHDIKLTEFLPDYQTYGKSAPLKRNILIINHADQVFAFWDGESSGTKFVINNCKKLNVPIRVFIACTYR